MWDKKGIEWSLEEQLNLWHVYNIDYAEEICKTKKEKNTRRNAYGRDKNGIEWSIEEQFNLWYVYDVDYA